MTEQYCKLFKTLREFNKENCKLLDIQFNKLQ